MQSWLSPTIEHGSSSLVDSDVSGINHVEGTSEIEGEDGEDWISYDVLVKINAETICDIRYVKCL